MAKQRWLIVALLCVGGALLAEDPSKPDPIKDAQIELLTAQLELARFQAQYDQDPNVMRVRLRIIEARRNLEAQKPAEKPATK